jgi:hypothetical protein
MDIQSKQPISDDQELAKVLAGITAGADTAVAPADLASNLEKEAATDDNDAMTGNPEADPEPEPVVVPQPDPVVPSIPVPPAPVSDSSDDSLESIKSEALNELRPLVDKLNVSPEEKFDTYLLLIRSTDDKSLIGPAHDAAAAIVDEARRAQALLDVIKEIDYLSNPQKQAA